jgi:hypothetical protein
LAAYGVNGLPSLVDLLPIMVASTDNVQMPRPLLDSMRLIEVLAASRPSLIRLHHD